MAVVPTRDVAAVGVPVTLKIRTGPAPDRRNGAAIARGVSYLKDKLGQQIFGAHINIIDDPHMQRGAGSRPFDGEGLANERFDLIKDGVLTTWILNSAQARQLARRLVGLCSRVAGAAAVSTA